MYTKLPLAKSQLSSVQSPLVSVLILNYKNAKAAVKCAEHFLNQSIADRLEIIVIDNHSDDDSIGILQNKLSQYPQVRIVETPENGGFGKGYNTGAKHAKGTYLLINNPDKLPEHNGIEKLVHAMEEDPSIGIIAPKLLHPDGSQRLSMRRFPRVRDIVARRSILNKIIPGSAKRYLMLDTDPTVRQEVDWIAGGCFLIRAETYAHLGGFDERFFLFFEDTDICKRCHDMGLKVVYEPNVTGSDKKKRLSGESFRDILFKKIGRIHLMSAVRYFRKWGMKI